MINADMENEREDEEIIKKILIFKPAKIRWIAIVRGNVRCLIMRFKRKVIDALWRLKYGR